MVRLAVFLILLVCSEAVAQVPTRCQQYRELVTESARSTFGPNAPVAALGAQLMVESSCRENLTSSAKAVGLCQFIPSTYEAMARNYADLRPAMPLNPRWCIRARDRLIQENHRRYEKGRSDCTTWLLGFLAYNGSPAALDREIALCRADEKCDPTRYFYHIELKRSRVEWAWKENRQYPISILTRQPLYATWGPQICQ